MSKNLTQRNEVHWSMSPATGWLLLLMLLAFGWMAWLGYQEYLGFNVRYFDLGAMSQAVWSATQGEPLIFTGQGIPLSRLARNVEFFYFLLAPAYALFPTPVTLIVLQAAFYAAAAFPLFNWAKRRLENGRYALLLCLIYLLYPAAQTAVLFEIHGDTFAMPLLIFALDALDREAWRSYSIWLLLALSAKFYVAAPVAALGFILLLQGRRRVGWATLIAGVSWGIFSFFIVFPYFAPAGSEAEAARATISSYVASRFVGMDLANTAVLRLVNAIIVFMPAVIVLGWRAPKWLLPAAAIAVPALFSVGFGPSFSYRTHHYAVAVPFLIAAILEAARQQKENPPPEDATAKRPAWQGRLILTFLVVFIFNLAFVETPLSPFAQLTQIGDSSYLVTPRDAFKAHWLAETVPPNAPLAASCILAPRLVNRPTLYLTQRPVISPLAETIDEVDFVVTDALYDQAAGNEETAVLFSGGIGFERPVLADLLNNPEFKLIAAQDGLVLFGREGQALTQEVKVARVAERPSLQASFGNKIGLVSHALTAVDARTYQLEMTWVALTDLSQQQFVAVTQLDPLPHTRIVHLPTMASRPTNSWQENELIHETVMFRLPDELQNGRYPLTLSWHDSQNLFARDTDARSQLGDSLPLGTLTIP